MASFSFIIGIIGNVISLLVFSSPIGTFRRVVKKKSTENYKGLPYITTLLSTSLWCFYGLLKPGGLLVVTVNGAGAFLQFIYVTLFLIYAPKDKKVKAMKLVAIFNVGFLGLVIAVAFLAIHGNVRLTFVGIICAGLTIGMYASPLSAMVPNAIGFVLGSAQLIIYGFYKSSSEKSSEAREEEGSAHLVKGAIEMRDFDEAEEAQIKNRRLNKGRSLPKPSVSRQYSIHKIVKALSLDHP
ncbi:bidirectional sugar transporter SWEET16-like isoform X2 [Cornus florida]|uniref:bidirectional sugar transporter SWEET16-like isoform X2 n=1 Tax=Cornus florida TaxID=4283 RepID=UPI00289817BE|nr:bidirectional sugar transporter SWEET16-like isoform X2 [Cornus florida]